MPKLNINGNEVEVEDGITLLQACEQAGAEIPRFCYHERLSIAGNCRMCLVEIAGMPKPMASCAMNVSDLRPNRDGTPPTILTDSPLVKKAREGVMEFLLINHPLDCPICDQGGECDLQDQAMYYGSEGSRYRENKRAVEEKYLGPLIKTFMTRCIQCTRCVRFMSEVAGVPELGAIGRGEDMEISTYLERGLHSELSGNVIDLCPVGALTSKPYSFLARPWELRKTESIDVMDGLGSNIRIDSRGREVMRILPRNHDGVNEEWLSDKSRALVDGLKKKRLDRPYMRRDGVLEEVSWYEAFTEIAARVEKAGARKVGAIAGDLCSVEDMFALKTLLELLGSPNMDCRQHGQKLHPRHGRGSYLFNATIAGISKADVILLVGTNPRKEAAVLNARIRGAYLHNHARIGLIGPQVDLTYPYEWLGNSLAMLDEIAKPDNPVLKALADASHPLIIVGQDALSHEAGDAVLAKAAEIAAAAMKGREDAGWNPLSILHASAALVGGLDIGFVPGDGGLDTAGILEGTQSGDIEVLYLLGADEFDVSRTGDAFVIYQGSHGDSGARIADIILPGAAYTEKNGTYVNTEGRVQLGERAIFPPGDAREDWTILRALSEHLGAKLPFDCFGSLRRALYKAHPHLAAIDTVEAAPLELKLGDLPPLPDAPFGVFIEDFYQTNPIARSSAVLAELSALHQEYEQGLAGADG
ncbi:NADH-quinone oxidoreductase subunit NuoG [Rhodomicrobium sp. Az07]|uniref:NADH-quinone oxidoreductase subunit NuoG n=1 Tax=Rhodomicrobium sp. Az07 TaxID=2839034 RepID=UPI001BECEE25|nr:NADH-quinone oxidoreductase subunit NuoG [Rhodomicrobium sp. Az07]MBT3070395.1 NADH-quinone oxidoreductase subunit NuoG [Rhodomicrobium sp. Az07]